MAGAQTLGVRVRIAWWFTWLYAPLVVIGSRLTGLSPDFEKVRAVATRAVHVKILGTP